MGENRLLRSFSHLFLFYIILSFFLLYKINVCQCAGAAYGEEALKVATTIKLTRALWIIPMAFATSFIFKSKGQKISIPWFIFFFVLALVVNTYLLDGVPQLGAAINGIARKTLTITMFFIGASLSIDVLKAVDSCS